MPDLHKIVRPFVPFEIGVTTVVSTPRKSTQENIKHSVGGNGQSSGQGGSWSYSSSQSGYADQQQQEVQK